MSDKFVFACPVCRGPLVLVSANVVHCPVDDLIFCCEEGVWRFLPPERAAALAQFRQEYETVRRSEGRAGEAVAFYRALPFLEEENPQIRQIAQIFPLRSFGASRDKSSQLNSYWGERVQSFRVLVEEVIWPLENQLQRPLKILDLGAGNGWLSNRLAARGHELAAVDLGVNDWDGLGAQRHYETEFTCLQAEFDHLPLEAEQADLIIFNASFHYSVNYGITLQEALRVLRPNGQVVVMDTAVYQYSSSGQQMVAEREAAFLREYGFASNALPSENFLTYGRIQELAAVTHLERQLHWPVPAWRRWARQVKVALRQQREPAQFPLLVFTAEAAERTAAYDDPSSSASSALPAVQFFRIGRNAGWLLAARVGQQAILLLFTALVARQLGDVGLGQLAWVTAVLYLGNIFSTWGLDTALLRQIGAERQTESVPLAAALLLELLLAALFIGALFLLPFLGQSPETIAGLRLFAWVLLPLAVLTLTNAALRGFEQMGWLAVLTLGTAVLQVAGTAVLFAVGGDFIGLMGWLLAVQVAAAGASWWLCRRMLPNFAFYWRMVNWQTMRDLVMVGFWLALLMVTAVSLQRLGILLLGWLGTEAQTGQLAAALRLAEAARLLPGAVMGAVFPVLAREKVAGDKWQVAGGQVMRYRWGLFVYGLLAAAGLWLLAHPLVILLFGDGYATAVSLLRILAWGVLPFALSLPLSVELVVAGQEKRVLLATLVVLVGTAVFTTAAFGMYGVNGVAAGLLASEWLLLAALLLARRAKRILEVKT